MLDLIFKTISTTIFVVCTMLVNSVVPPIAQEKEIPVMASVVESPVGEWEAFGHRYRFTKGGRLITSEESFKWKLDKDNIIVTIGGEEKRFPISFEGENIMHFNGVTMYRVK